MGWDPGLRLSLSAHVLAGCGEGRRSPQGTEGKPQPAPTPGRGEVPRVQKSQEETRHRDRQHGSHGEEENNPAKGKESEKQQRVPASSEVPGHFKEQKFK